MIARLAALPESETVTVSKKASARIKITNKLGMHARPAMLFVETASKFGSTVQVRRADNDEHVDGKSIMQLMMLAATCGTEIEVIAEGDDAHDAVNELVNLITSHFMED